MRRGAPPPRPVTSRLSAFGGSCNNDLLGATDCRLATVDLRLSTCDCRLPGPPPTCTSQPLGCSASSLINVHRTFSHEHRGAADTHARNRAVRRIDRHMN